MKETSALAEAATGVGTSGQAKSSSDEIFRDIVGGLYEGRFVPGQRLVEADLTREFGVSRGTVREALKRLSAEGLVSISLHRGAQIRRLTRKDARDILVLLEMLTGLSARLCAERIGEDGVAEAFSQRYDELMAHRQRPDPFGIVRARNRFFRALVDLSGNGELQRVMPSLHLHLIRVQVRSREIEDRIERLDDYRAIGEAILAGDADDADAAARNHVRHFAAVIAELPDTLFAPERLDEVSGADRRTG